MTKEAIDILVKEAILQLVKNTTAYYFWFTIEYLESRTPLLIGTLAGPSNPSTRTKGKSNFFPTSTRPTNLPNPQPRIS